MTDRDRRLPLLFIWFLHFALNTYKAPSRKPHLSETQLHHGLHILRSLEIWSRTTRPWWREKLPDRIRHR
jgi:hypothetical protein